MASNLSDERNELQEDDEKLQIALHEFDNQWGDEYYSEEDEEEDEDQLLIDLDYATSVSEHTVNSNTPSFTGSATQSQSITIADEESGEAIPRPNIVLPSQIDVIEHRADPEKTLHLNRILQGILEEHINEIKEALRENKERQNKLQQDVSDYSTKPEKMGVYSGSFRAPYFRHVNSYPPSNEDVSFKKETGDYEIVTVDLIKDLRRFNKSAKEMLREAVLESYLEQILKPVVIKMEFEIQKRDKCTEELNDMSFKLEGEKSHLEEMQKGPRDSQIELMIKEMKKTIQELKAGIEEKRKIIDEYRQEIDRLEKEINSKRSIPEDEVLKTVDSEKVDWMKIAKQNFGGHCTWLDCQKAWENLVSPAINKKTWAKEDDKKLVELVKSTRRDWKEVAKAMGNGRTPFQCFSHYQQHFNSDLKPRPWTDEEDARLVRVTNNVKDSVGFFGWSKVSTLMDSRSPVECMYRFTKVDPSQHRGRWTELEDAKLLAAVKMIGPCWSKISKFINTRNMVQCRDRYLNCLAPNINFSHFTYDEDVKLLKLYKNLGPAWAKMVPEFIGRTDNMLLSRYRQLQKWKQQNEWFGRQSDATKKMLLGKSLTVAERRIYQEKAFGYIRDQLGIATEDYKRQELDKQNGVDPDVIPTRPPRHLRCYTVGGQNKGGSLNKWSVKLDTHRRLTENLHRLLEKEALATKAKKGKAQSTLPADVAEQILEKTVEETLKGNNQIKTVSRSKVQIKKLEAALNKVFLTEGTVSVQELLKSSLTEKKRARKQELNSIVESELKNILRRRGRALSKLGRSRRFFVKDTRPSSIIEEELDELDHSVPLILMKTLGTNIHYLGNEIQHQCLQAQEELSNQPSYEDDVDFKTEEAETQAAIQKLLMRTDISDLYKQQQLSVLKRKLKCLRRIYSEKAFVNSKIGQNKFSSFHDDLDYLETLADEKKEMEVNKNFLLMTCSPSGSFDPEFEEVIGTISSSPTSSSLRKTSTFPSTITSYEDKSSESSEFAVPLLPLRKKRTRFSARQLSNSQNEPVNKRFKALSKQDIADERIKLPNMTKKVFINLPYLPPSLSTLLGLRALFFMKKELIQKAGGLYRTQKHGNISQLGVLTNNAMQLAEGNNAEGNPGDNPVQDSGSWFLYTNPQQLTEQASSFEGYRQHNRTPGDATQTNQMWNNTVHPQSHNYDSGSFENEAFIIPLEERGGRLPDSGSRIGHNCGIDLKPVVTEQKESPVMASAYQTNSGYEVIMGYSCKTAKYACQKGVQMDQQTSMRTTGTKSMHMLQNSVSIIPDYLIKTDNSDTPGHTETGFTHYISSYNDAPRARINLPKSGRASAQTETRSMLDIGEISLHPVRQTGGNIGDDDDDDVLAVIDFDDDDDDNANPANTVINICSGLTNNTSELNTSNDGQIVIFSEEREASQILSGPQETNRSSDLSNLKLPESRVRKILSNKILKNRTSQIVLVGVDTDSKTIVHFKPEEDRFKAYEAIPTSIAESNSSHYIDLTQSAQPEKTGIPQRIPDCMKTIRQTDEYKLLLARFKSLFMWPVLMSTIKPSPLNDGSLPTKLRKVVQEDLQSSEGQKGKQKRLRGKQSIAKREHLQIIREASLAARKRTNKKLSSGKRKHDDGEDEMEGKINVVSLKQPDVPNKTAPEINKEDSDGCVVTSVAGSGGVSEPPKRRGRPKGSKNKKYDLAQLKELPNRAAKNVQKVTHQSLDTSCKEPVRSLPQWWKDAILAAMLAKKAMVDDGEEDCEVNLEDDNDFIDKGNYSDDEWYQQLRQQETVTTTQPSTEQVCLSDPVTLTLQDNVAE